MKLVGRAIFTTALSGARYDSRKNRDKPLFSKKKKRHRAESTADVFTVTTFERGIFVHPTSRVDGTTGERLSFGRLRLYRLIRLDEFGRSERTSCTRETSDPIVVTYRRRDCAKRVL